MLKALLVAGLLLLTAIGVLMVSSSETTKTFVCVIESDRQKGTVVTFETGLNRLTWGSRQPQVLDLEKEQLEPFELVAVDREGGISRVGLRIYSDGNDLRFRVNAGDDFHTGRCKGE